MKQDQFRFSMSLMTLLFVAATVGCAPSDSSNPESDLDQKDKVAEIHAEDGYYLARFPTKMTVPAVSINQIGNNTHVHSLVKYECRERIYAAFFESGMSLGGRPGTVVASPSLQEVDDCSVSTSVVAENQTTLKVLVKINGVEQEPYLLFKVEKQRFLKTVQKIAADSHHFEVSNQSCEQSLGAPCSKVGLKDSDAGTYANH